MQAIYDALLLISTNPNQATKALNHLAHVNPNFLQLLKTMSLELKSRFDPRNAQAYGQYDRMSKHILVIFNRFVILAFQERGNSIYLKIQDYYYWMLQILVCQTIDFNHKKVLQPALTQIIDSLCFKKDHLLQFLDRIIADHIDTSAAIFIYLQSLLKSSVYSSPKIESIQHSYKALFYIALRGLTKMVEFYKHKYMDLDEGNRTNSNSHFISILKQNEFILRTLCDCISFLYNQLSKQRHSNHDSSLVAGMLLDPDLAVYLSRVLKIETEMFDRSILERNPYELRIIIAKEMHQQNKMYVPCKYQAYYLALKLILSMTDKDFNLIHTDKILLKELPILTRVIVQELIICSYENVISTLGEEIEIIGIVSSLFDVLTEIVVFRDIKPILHKLSIEQIVRLTLAFMKTYHEERELFQNEVEEYFVLVYYILYGRVDEGEDQSIDLTLGQFCMKKNVVELIKNMSLSIQGFNSILMQLCRDTILLFSKRTPQNQNQLNQMFIQKHKLQYSTLQCLDLQSAIFTFTVALENYSNEAERKKSFRFLLETVNTYGLREMELCRLFTCLTVHSKEWEDRDIQCKYYKIIELAFKNTKTQNSVGKQAFYFLERLAKAPKKCYQNRHYSIFIDKILNDVLGQLEAATSVFIFDFITHAVTSTQVQTNIINLSWVNLCLDRLNRCINRQIVRRQLLHEVLTSIFLLYQTLIKAGVRLSQQNKDHSYPSFESQLQQFNDLINNLLSHQILTIFTQILNQKQLINEQYHMLYKFSDLIFTMLISNITLSSSTSTIISSFTLSLLPRTTTCDLDFSNTIFKLLYQLVNRSPYMLQQRHYSILLRWMKDNIDGVQPNEINLNRVCLILQQLYYFIRSNAFRGQQITSFFEGVTVAIEKKFLKYLLDYNEYLSMIEKESDEDIKKIKLSNLQCGKDSRKKFSVTVIRLYNTILMNPNLNPKSLHLVKDIIKHYIHETIPPYDLSVHFLALGYIINNSKNSAAVECFRQGLQLLYYNALHPDHTATESSIHREIRNLTKELKSPIAAIDPYRELHELVTQQISRNRDGAVVVDYNQSFEDLQIDVVEFIRSDRYTLDLVKKLVSIRRVNDQPRVIRKIKRTMD